MAEKRKRSIKEKPGHRPGEAVHVLISNARIKQRVKQMAREIRRDLPNDPLHLIGVLKGSVFFLSDLAQQLGGEVSFDFIAVSSYGKGSDSTGEVKLIKDLDVSIQGRDVLVVEDILDTGRTFSYLQEVLGAHDPASLKLATLLDKHSRRVLPVEADYVGFEIPDVFVVGYGLDFDQKYRNLPDIRHIPSPQRLFSFEKAVPGRESRP